MGKVAIDNKAAIGIGAIAIAAAVVGGIFLLAKTARASVGGWVYSAEEGPIVPSGVGDWMKVDFTAIVTNESEEEDTREVYLYVRRYAPPPYGGWGDPYVMLTRVVVLAPGEAYEFSTGAGEELLIAYGELVEVWLEDSRGGHSRHIKADLTGQHPE